MRYDTEPRFDWGAIFRAAAIVIVVTAIIGFAIPPILTIALGYNHTGRVAGNDLYRWAYWGIAWALTIWQGAWMRRAVGDRIWDDMAFVGVIVAAVLFALKMLIALIYEPISSEGALMPIITSLDTGGALMLIFVALVGAGANRIRGQTRTR